jgi:dolichol kinase
MAAIKNLLGSSLRSVKPSGLTLTNLRKLIHLSALLVPILTEVTSKTIVLTALSIIVVLYAVEEALRLKGRSVPAITSFTLRMSRPEETGRFIVRPIYLAVGVILALLLFPTRIAYASIGIVAVGDPVAAYVGERFGRRHLRPNKTLEGLIAGLVISFILASIIVYPVAAFAGAAGAMLMELLDIPDDNLTMPIAAGVLISLVGLAAH